MRGSHWGLALALISQVAGAGDSAPLSQTGDFWRATTWTGIQQGTPLHSTVRSVTRDSFETANGTTVYMRPWYSSAWVDTKATWLTEITPNFGVIWGVTTGEIGGKYRIEPSMSVGWLYVKSRGKTSWFELRAGYVFGGRLSEKPCHADYGEIGGIQAVNCRMAASSLAPGDTLEYLYDSKPPDKVTASIQIGWKF